MFHSSIKLKILKVFLKALLCYSLHFPSRIFHANLVFSPFLQAIHQITTGFLFSINPDSLRQNFAGLILFFFPDLHDTISLFFFFLSLFHLPDIVVRISVQIPHLSLEREREEIINAGVLVSKSYEFVRRIPDIIVFRRDSLF